MAARSLPDQPNLDQLKKQAKDLLKAYRAGDPEALQTFAESRPHSSNTDPAKLTDAQYVLSRSYGFDSWPKLRREVAGLQLRRAIWSGDVESARNAVSSEPETLHDSGPHPRWGGQPTPIQIAAERGNTDLVTYLLESGADPD